jgi:hypothetical protein
MGKPSLNGILSIVANNLSSITPWITHLGYQNCFISAAFVGMAASSVFFIMMVYGKMFRTRSAEKYYQLAEDGQASH